jgi:hypothetical protein
MDEFGLTNAPIRSAWLSVSYNDGLSVQFLTDNSCDVLRGRSTAVTIRPCLELERLVDN